MSFCSGVVPNEISVYTESGWKSLNEVTSRDKIAQIDIKSGLITLDYPLTIIRGRNTDSEKVILSIGVESVLQVSASFGVVYYDLSDGRSKERILPANQLTDFGSKFIPIYTLIDFHREKRRFNSEFGFNFYDYLDENRSIERVALGHIVTCYSEPYSGDVVNIKMKTGFYFVRNGIYTILLSCN